MKTWIVLILSVVTTHMSHLYVESVLPGYLTEYANRRLVMKPELAKAFSLGFDRTLSDCYWLLFLQYYGDPKAVSQNKFAYAPAYLRLIVTLDPHFTKAYWFCAFALAGDMHSLRMKQSDKVGAKEILDEASRLLDQGVESNPTDWSIPYIAGMSQYLFARNSCGEKGAAYYYGIAAKRPGAPEWLNKWKEIMESGVPSLYTDWRTWEMNYARGDAATKSVALQKLQTILSQEFYFAPTQLIKNNAMKRLKELDLPLLDRKDTPDIETQF